jgi:hypothetical protein
LTARPFSTVTRIAQVSGQSCGQTARANSVGAFIVSVRNGRGIGINGWLYRDRAFEFYYARVRHAPYAIEFAESPKKHFGVE